MIKARDYFNSAPIMQAGQARAQQYQNNGQLFGDLIKALSQIATTSIQQKQAQDWASPKDYAVNDIPRNPTTVSTDLLGKPINEQTVNTTGYGGMPVSYQRNIPITLPTQQETGTFNPTQDPQRLIQGLMNTNPFIQQMAERGIQGIQLTAPKYQFGNAGDLGVQTNPLSSAPNVSVPNRPQNPQAPKKIGQATENGRIVATMSDGTKIDLGESFESERLKLAKENVALAKQRIANSKDDKIKSEGKYLIEKYDDTEKQYNKNMIYLTDMTIAPATRARIEDEQVELSNKMAKFGEDIQELGKSPLDVISTKKKSAQEAPAPQKPKADPLKIY